MELGHIDPDCSICNDAADITDIAISNFEYECPQAIAMFLLFLRVVDTVNCFVILELF